MTPEEFAPHGWIFGNERNYPFLLAEGQEVAHASPMAA